MTRFRFAIVLLLAAVSTPRAAHADAPLWHKHTLDFTGPDTAESATPNPFTDYRLDVTFTNGDTSYTVPGYYAADGDAANTSADAGSVWRVHFAPDQLGEWSWRASFRQGPGVATSDAPEPGNDGDLIDGSVGRFTAVPSPAKLPDFRARGRLDYVGSRYPRTAGDGKIFLKVGADSPENFLSYAEFDGGFKTDGKKDQRVKTWAPHVQDWAEGDPTWGSDQRGKGIIGALNYLASAGLNAVSMLTMNIEGDDANVFPYTSYDERERFDVSRLDQWLIVLDHGAARGLFYDFKTQETENETLLDNGEVGPQRRLYYRELVARFGHLPALNWNLGEENGVWGKHHKKEKFQTTAQRKAMARWFADHDPYRHPIVCHNGQWPEDLYGPGSALTGWSLQTSSEDFHQVHPSTLKILRAAEKAGKPWMVSCDEPGDASHAAVPDQDTPDHFDARTNALWGNFLAGGWGVDWYYGYQHDHSDLTLEDHRSRARLYGESAHALRFFDMLDLPLDDMDCHDDLLSDADGFVLARPGDVYVVLAKNAARGPSLDLGTDEKTYRVQWFNPRAGGALQTGSRDTVSGPGDQDLGTPPTETDRDWVVLVRHEGAGHD